MRNIKWIQIGSLQCSPECRIWTMRNIKIIDDWLNKLYYECRIWTMRNIKHDYREAGRRRCKVGFGQ